VATVRRKRCRAGQLRDPVGDAHSDSADDDEADPRWQAA